MFSGIVEEVGLITEIKIENDIKSIWIDSKLCTKDSQIGDSISVNGTCLTICEIKDNIFMFQAMPETLRLTNIDQLKTGDIINLERSIRADTRIGGHFVQGHIDTFTEILAIEYEGDSKKIWFKAPPEIADYLIPKGYIAIDGMSLTLVDVHRDIFSICFIPHTQSITVVKNYQIGTYVNVEIDHLTKTVFQIMDRRMNHAI